MTLLLTGFPASFHTVKEVTKFITMVIFTVSAQHAAVNNGQVRQWAVLDSSTLWHAAGLCALYLLIFPSHEGISSVLKQHKLCFFTAVILRHPSSLLILFVYTVPSNKKGAHNTTPLECSNASWNFSHYLVWLLLGPQWFAPVAQTSTNHQGRVKHEDNFGDPPKCWRDGHVFSSGVDSLKQVHWHGKLVDVLKLSRTFTYWKYQQITASIWFSLILSFWQVPLGTYPDERFDEPAPKQMIKDFQAELSCLSEAITERNSQLKVPYTYLNPNQIENSITI